MHYTYLLKSKKNGQLYIGSTNDLRKRIEDHNKGKVFSTARYLPWKILYYEAYISEKLARIREKRLKYNGNALKELKKRVGLSSFKPKSGGVYPAPLLRTTHKSGAGFIALTSVLIIGAIVLILGISLFHSALTDYSISTAFESGQEAAFLADFCLKEGMLKLQENINYIGGEEIGLNNATCTINFVKKIDENTKEISSLGRAGDQPHFSRSSRLIRYIIEPGESGWVVEGDGASLEKVEVVGNSLRLSPAEAEVITRDENFAEYFYFDDNLEITGDGSLVLKAIEVTYACSDGLDNDEDGLIDYPADTGCESTEDDDEYNEPEPKKENGEACSVPGDCYSGNCLNGICCVAGQTCCSSDAHCPVDSCLTTCQKRDNYCDSTTDYYCKYTNSNCSSSQRCVSAACQSGQCAAAYCVQNCPPPNEWACEIPCNPYCSGGSCLSGCTTAVCPF